MSQQPSQLPKSTDDENQSEMFIRVKRNETTYFLQCLPSAKILQIKEKLEKAIRRHVNDQRLILFETGEVLDDSQSLADQKVENFSAGALTLRQANNEFEDVNVVKIDDQRVLKLSYDDENSNIVMSHFSLGSLLHRNENDPADEMDVDYPPFDEAESIVSVLGYSNGLFCVSLQNPYDEPCDVFLWNPSTKELKELPSFPDNMNQQGFTTVWGFGCVKDSDKYKVVALLVDPDRCESTVCLYFDESWKHIQSSPLDAVPKGEEHGQFVDGKLHWLMEGDRIGNICSFDLDKEIHDWLEMPNFGRDVTSPALLNFEGSLCLLCEGKSVDDLFDLWVMKEDKSWVKLLQLKCTHPRSILKAKPLCICDKGKVLLSFGSEFLICNLNNPSIVFLLGQEGEIKFRDYRDIAHQIEFCDIRDTAFLFNKSMISLRW